MGLTIKQRETQINKPTWAFAKYNARNKGYLPIKTIIKVGANNLMIQLYEDWTWFSGINEGTTIVQYYLFKNKLPFKLEDDKEYILLESHGELKPKEKNELKEKVKEYMTELIRDIREHKL